MSIKAVIIDDEDLAIYALKQELELHFSEIELLGFAQNIPDAIELVNQTKPEVIFLDIQVEDRLGFELLEQIEATNIKVIFTTAYSKYAIRAIKYSACDYLLKPIDVDELSMTLGKIKNQKADVNNLIEQIEQLKKQLNSEDQPKEILVKSGAKLVRISPGNIEYIEAYGNYSKVWVNSKWIVSDNSLKQNEELLADFDFIRISRTYLVNKSLIKTVDFVSKEIILNSKVKLTISSRKLAYVRKVLKS